MLKTYCGETTWDFTYDANGMRTKRTNGSTTYEYVYNGSQLSQMTVDGKTLRFTYGTDGSPTSVTYGTSRYFYVKNLQGDVMALVSVNGVKVVEYTYDAWGNILYHTDNALLNANPLRYRGYVYDQETELCYLQSRYYDPQVGRFINADAYAATGQSLLGNNMFSYCKNNPSTMVDPSGTICVTCYSDDPFLEMFESTGGGGGGYSGVAFVYQYAKDAHGEGAAAEGYGSPSSNRYGAEVYAQKLYYSYDFFAVENDGVILVDGSMGMVQATLSWWDGFLSLTPVDWFGAEISAGASISQGLHFSALAYTMAVSGSIDFGAVEISVTGYAGAIGVEFAAGFGEVTIGGAAPNGVGGSITIRWDTE